jgi:SAM-dependent methyltransferase
MLEQEYKRMFEQEESNWYFRGKRAIVFGFLSRQPKRRGVRILDVGCGTGINMQLLSRFGETFGIDVSERAIAFCQQRGLQGLGIASIERLPFKSNTFDVVTCLDVLYHKGVRDGAALRELERVSKDGALLLITESALKRLWSEHDQAVEAKTRYSIPEFRAMLSKTSFDIVKASYWNFFVFPIVFLLKKLSPPKANPSEAKSNVVELPALLNFILSKALSIEAGLLRWLGFPIGVDLFIAAKKNKKDNPAE